MSDLIEEVNIMSEPEKKRAHKRGNPPTIIPRKVSEWIKEAGTNSTVESWRVGGGKPMK